MLIGDDGQTTGVLSGGCLEYDVSKRALEVLRTKTSRVITYDTTSDEDIVWGLGIGCSGIVQILIEPLADYDDELIAFLERSVAGEERGVLVTVIDNQGNPDIPIGTRTFYPSLDQSPPTLLGADLLADVSSAASSGRSINRQHYTAAGPVEVFIDPIEPAVPLVIFGAGDDVLPVVELAHSLGWLTTVVDTRSRRNSLERFEQADRVVLTAPENVSSEVFISARTIVLVMTHNYLHDLELLTWLLAQRPRYLGCLGPRARAEKLVSELTNGDVELAATYFGQLHAPAGLDIGAETSREIAVSIMAEIRAVLSSRSGGLLRNRLGPIHEIDGANEFNSTSEQQAPSFEWACSLKGN
jgi:xanthine/CO dehydrogenase XdhC/CoxF family maturation factor